jgi:nucleotide-binding universal stress UspA family protein
MERILIATDGSPSAGEAVDFGLQLAREHGAEAVFVVVAPSYDVLPVQAFGMSGAQPHKPTMADRAPLEAAADLAKQSGVRAKTELLAGDPADEIVAFADSIDADLIVVGSRGHGAVASVLLGSVSRGVLREARRPVLIARKPAERAHEPVAAASRLAEKPQDESGDPAASLGSSTDGGRRGAIHTPRNATNRKESGNA